MIALVTSTLFPPQSLSSADSYRSNIHPNLRIQQTFETITSLKELGINKIYLADNGGKLENTLIKTLTKDVVLLKIPTFQFLNKGLSELFLIHSALKLIEEEKTPILKISGRYKLSSSVNFDSKFDFLFKREGEHCVSTRCYLAANKSVYESLINETINIYLNHNSKVIGPRSLLRIIKSSLSRNETFNVELMLEAAIFKSLILKKYKIQNATFLGVSGILGGSNSNVIINE